MVPEPVRTREQTSIVRVPRQRQSYLDAAVTDVAPDPVRGTRSRRGVMLPVLLCGAAALAAAAALGAVAIGSATHTTHSFVVPDRSGHLVRDEASEKTLAPRVARAEHGFRAQFGDRLDTLVTAAYVNAAPAAGRPSGSLVFVGAAIDTSGDPDDFIAAFRGAARDAGYSVRTVPAGSGAQGACMESEAGGAGTCAWSTGDSVGELVPAGTGWDVDALAAAMRTMRGDAEVAQDR